MPTDRQKPNLTSFIVLTSAALPLIMLGVFGLTSPETLPWLATPRVAWSMIAVGIIIDLAAMFVLFGEIKRVKQKTKAE